MSRLRFRAWDIIDNKMDEVCSMDNTGDYNRGWYVKFEHGGREQAWNPNVVIMQYTGLMDKNGKPIYEGDIVKVNPDHLALKLTTPDVDTGKDYRLEYTKGQIMWQCQGWWVGQKYLGATEMKEFALCECCPCGLEVIGNIYENKNLIEE